MKKLAIKRFTKQRFDWIVRLVIFIYAGIPTGMAAFASIEPCNIHSQQENLCSCEISKLHPTQLALGMIEVRHKKTQVQNSDIDRFKKKHAVPTVLDPFGNLYILDHHHLVRAYFELGIEKTICVITAKSFGKKEDDFWHEMKQNHWLYLYDENGVGPYPLSKLPSNIAGLSNDPYRSLAGIVRDADGFKKTSEPFVEFKWANFFRTRIRVRYVGEDFDPSVIKEAYELAQSPEAKDLPGFVGDGWAF